MKRNKMQILVCMLLFALAFSLHAEAQQNKQITMEFKAERLPSVFKRLEKFRDIR